MGTATAQLAAIADAVIAAFGVTGGVTVRWCSGGSFVASTGKWSGTVQSGTVSADEHALTTFIGENGVRIEERVYHIRRADLVAASIPDSTGVLKQGMTIIGSDGVERMIAAVDLQVESTLYRVRARRERGGTR